MIQGPERNAVWLKARHRADMENNLKIREEEVISMKVYDILIVYILCVGLKIPSKNV